MASERSLATLLRAFQKSTGEQDGHRLLGSAATLLTLLSNPRNLSLLSHQILSAPAIWDRPDGLNTVFQVLGVFNSASVQVLHRDEQQAHADYHFGAESLTKGEWVKTVVKGADDRTPRWKHLLILGGLLIGFEAQDRHGLPPELRKILEHAVVTAANLAIEDDMEKSELALHTVCLVISHTFDLLDNLERSRLNRDGLLPLLTQAVYFSRDGLQWGYFLGTMDADVIQDKKKFNWSSKSSTFFQVQKISSSPLTARLGSLSRIIAFCAESVSDVELLFKFVENITTFTRSLCVQWQQNKLSELDISEEGAFLHEETQKVTLPVLWQLLKSVLFSVVIGQSVVFGRLIGDNSIPNTQHPFVAIQTLHSLRNLYFITTRFGIGSFSQHTFVYMASIDILSKYPVQAEALLREIRPVETGSIPEHPHLRCLDLFFLNTSENFTAVLPPFVNEELLLPAAAPYTGSTSGSPRLIDLFEAAHSVTLAIFSSHHNYSLTNKHLLPYLNTLFAVFPRNLSSRQFRIAIKTLVRVTSPPYGISETEPLFPYTILEIVRSRSETASLDIIPSPTHQLSAKPDVAVSEQAAMVLALIDSLTVLPFYGLEEWLPLTSSAMNCIQDHKLLEVCRHRFWEVLSNGEMDVKRAEACLAWWNTKGGRQAVLQGAPALQGTPVMSGALPQHSKI